MTELYGVCTDGVDKNYLRRLPDGRVSTSLGGRFMTKDCAEQLCRVLRIQGYPKATVVRLFRNGEDEAPAEGLLQLENEKLPINLSSGKKFLRLALTPPNFDFASTEVLAVFPEPFL